MWQHVEKVRIEDRFVISTGADISTPVSYTHLTLPTTKALGSGGGWGGG